MSDPEQPVLRGHLRIEKEPWRCYQDHALAKILWSLRLADPIRVAQKLDEVSTVVLGMVVSSLSESLGDMIKRVE
ncbi:hypothetical protein ACNJYD_10705 [Bradyrhizobium sp. DASA03005]|uniref:hypothetical protein n=1 Tax=Bradyrhizobium sp. SPXBL-02 TaxID=3395912 RepID=UPI003F718B1D